MNNPDKILNFLKEHRSKYCDDHLSSETKITPRQTVYTICNSLAAKKKIIRGRGICSVCQKHKFVNSFDLAINMNSSAEKHFPPVDSEISKDRPWHWEGNIQSILVKYLTQQGITVTRAADTETREQGIDIEAISKSGAPLWITVKGYPEDKGKANPNTQARHWFSQAIFDVVLYRNESELASLAVGLPDGYSTYINLAKRMSWFLKASKAKICWVSKSGHVRET